MARRVIRAEVDHVVSDGHGWIKKPFDITVYRIEWPNGTSTDTGLFRSVEFARRYARERGWQVDLDMVREQWEESA